MYITTIFCDIYKSRELFYTRILIHFLLHDSIKRSVDERLYATIEQYFNALDSKRVKKRSNLKPSLPILK